MRLFASASHTLIYISVVVCSLQTARADVSGLEHLSKISVECGLIEKAKPAPVDGISMCSYTDINCKVMDKGVFQLEASITADCKAEGVECPDIGACSKAKLSGPAADAVRKKNDPNYYRPDGHENPLPKSERVQK
jgi:hypothetical protein